MAVLADDSRGCDDAARGFACSPLRRQHATEVQVVEGISRVHGPLAALRRSGDIDDSHVAAAERWYRDWVMGVEGAADPGVARTGKAPDIHAAMLSRVAASGRCTDVRRHLGSSAERRLRMVVLEELSFSEVGRRLMPGDPNARKKVAAQTAFLLELLAEHYEVRDSARRERTEGARS